jgi:hypothetical protein
MITAPKQDSRSNRRLHHAYRALAVVLLLIGGIAPDCARAASDYLSAIEAEGDRLEFLGKARQEEEALRRLQQQPARSATPPPAAPAPAAKAAAAASPAAGAANMKGFEEQLRTQFPASFALYSLMEQQDKEAIYGEYQKTKTEGTVRFLPVVSKIVAISSAKRAKGQFH